MFVEQDESEEQFKQAWFQIATEARQGRYEVFAANLLTHASKQDDRNNGLEFRPANNEDGTLRHPEIVSLERLPWSHSGFLILSGCNTGLALDRRWAPAHSFSLIQRVPTVGQSGFFIFFKGLEQLQQNWTRRCASLLVGLQEKPKRYAWLCWRRLRSTCSRYCFQGAWMNRRWSLLLSGFSWWLFAAGMVFWAAVGYRIVTVPENHISYDITKAALLFLACLVVSSTAAYLRKSIAYLLIACFALASVASIYVIDRQNVLVQYDEWLKRGMPGRPF